jgi:predicted RNA-binding Zn-ribbon protein involved in translation (DUF1610 family)
MSNYTLDEITKLVHKSNENNKSVIMDTIKQILIEDDSLNIKLLEMEKINKVFFKENDSIGNDSNVCTICFEEIQTREHKVKLKKCNHIFHKKCLNKYLKETLLNFKCPNCKKDYSKNLNNIVKNL